MPPMMDLAGLEVDAGHLVLALVALFLMGLVLLQVWHRAGLRARHVALRDTSDARCGALEERLAAARESSEYARQENERLRERLDNAEARSAELPASLSSMAREAVETAHKSFLARAGETFEHQQNMVAGRLETVLEPVARNFETFRHRIDALEQTRNSDQGALFEQVRAMSDQLRETQQATGRLASALSAPRGGGRWGETSLRNVLELAGLSEHADFTEQRGDDGAGDSRLRPDVVIRMPGGREIVIDAKVSISDFLQATEASGAEEKDACLHSHARKLRDHVNRLARKEYWKALDERIDFVVMYVPGENFFAAALQADSDLFDHGARNRVLIVTPATLVALAKAVAYGWREEAAAQNTREVARLGRDLYDALCAMGGHVERMGLSLDKAMGSYNAMIGSMERNVLPKARQFETLHIPRAGAGPVPGLTDLTLCAQMPGRWRAENANGHAVPPGEAPSYEARARSAQSQTRETRGGED
jgi:DNA recombination protein RmuC